MMKKKETKQKRPGKHRRLKIFLGIVLFLVIVRLLLPFFVLRYANKTLASLDGYYGQVRDIDLSLYRGSYQIIDLYLNKIDSVTGMQSNFFDARVIDLSVEWKSLFHGRLVGELTLDVPRLYFKKDKIEPDEVAKDTNDFRKLLDAFMPLKVNRFEVFQGELHYMDSTSKPIVDIQMDSVHILAKNLSNVVDSSAKGLPSSIEAYANIYRGAFIFDMQLDPLSETAKFDLNVELKDTYLPDLNDFFKAYAKVDVNKGTFGMYTELATADGKFVGYVKPIIVDLDVLGPEDRNDSFFRQLWEGTVGTTGKVLSNWKEDQLATKIPLEGTIKDPDAKIWVTIFEMLRNAFVNALQPSIDYDISIASVEKVEPEKKNIFEKIFGGKEEDEKENKKENKKDESKEKGKEKGSNK